MDFPIYTSPAHLDPPFIKFSKNFPPTPTYLDPSPRSSGTEEYMRRTNVFSLQVRGNGEP